MLNHALNEVQLLHNGHNVQMVMHRFGKPTTANGAFC